MDKDANFLPRTSAAAFYMRSVTTLGRLREYFYSYLVKTVASNSKERYMNAEKYGLDKIYFGGCFIRG